MTTNESGSFPLLANVLAPDIFASGVSGFALCGENIVITFEVEVVDHGVEPPAAHRKVAARLIMPIARAQRSLGGLRSYLEQRGFPLEDSPR